MLLSTYAKCIHSQEAAAQKRIAEALGGINVEDPDDQHWGADSRRAALSPVAPLSRSLVNG
jgi:hypothetical protein